MLESIASSLLTKYLGDYVEGLDSKNLQVSVGSGDVVLKSLNLKKSALRELELPITVKEGSLGQLTMKVPWANLGKEASTVRVSEVFLLCEPKMRSSGSAREEEERALASKLGRLQLAQVLGLDQPDPEPDSKKQENKVEVAAKGWGEQMGMKIVDNLQVFVEKIHIRYEDSQSVPGSPFAFGVTLDHLHIQSTDYNWTPAFLSVGQAILHKLVNLNHLGVYFDTGSSNNAKPLKYTDLADLQQQMRQMIYSKGNQTNASYLLHPISGYLKAQIDTEPPKFGTDQERPRVKLMIDLQKIQLSVDRPQIVNTLALMDNFTLYGKGLRYLKFRPPAQLLPRVAPKIWWVYVFRAISSEIHARNQKWTWAYIKQRSIDRNDYIELYKKKRNDKMSSKEVKQLEDLEKKLPYEDILLYRKLANAAFNREKQKAHAGGFLSWFGGGAAAIPAQSEEEVLKELYNKIGYSADADHDQEETLFPPNFVKVEIISAIHKARVRVLAVDAEPVTHLEMKELAVGVKLRDTSTSVSASLNSMNVEDFSTLNGAPLHMLSPSSGSRAHKFLTAEVDLNPIDCENPIDLRVSATMQPLDVIFSFKAIESIQKVFDLPPSAALTELTAAASKGADELTRAATKRLQLSLEEQPKVFIKLDLHAPTVIVPQDFSNPDCPTLIADLGRIYLSHDSREREKHISRDTIGSTNVSGVDVNYFYDTFTVKMAQLQVYLSPTSTHWHDMSSEEVAARSIVRKFDIDCDLRMRNVPSTDLPVVKLDGTLPKLQVTATKGKIRDILKIVNSILATILPSPLLHPDTVGEALPVSDDVITARKTVDTTVQTSRESILQANFILKSFSITVKDTKEMEDLDGPSLIRIQMNGLSAGVNLSNHDTALQLELSNLFIEDRNKETRKLASKYIVHTPTEGEKKLISLSFYGVPKNSPLFQGVLNTIKGKFGEMDVNVNRVTIASLLFWVQNLQRELGDVLPQEPAALPQPPVLSQEELAEGAIYTPSQGRAISKKFDAVLALLKVDFSMSSLRCSLVKDNEVFLRAALGDANIVLGLNEDTTMGLDVTLKDLSVVDFYNTQWSDTLATSRDGLAVSLSFYTFNRASPHYPGHDMAIGAKMGSVRAVFTNRIVKEVATYFSAFAKMQDVFSAATTQLAAATVERAKEFSATRMKLDVHITNPLVIVPRGTDSKEYLSLDLGCIIIHNEILPVTPSSKDAAEELIDLMKIKVEKFNLQTHQEDFDSVLFLHTNIDVDFSRPISENLSHAIPDMKMDIVVSDIHLDFKERVLDLIFGFLCENMTEPMGRPDAAELLTVSDLLNFDTSIWKTEEIANQAIDLKGQEPWQTLVLSASLHLVSFQVSKGTGIDENGESTALVNFGLKQLRTKLTLMADGAMAMTFALKGIVLDDVRTYSQSVYRRIMEPRAAAGASSGDQLEMVYKMANNTMDIQLHFGSPRVFLVPSFLFEVADFGTKLGTKAADNIALMTDRLGGVGIAQGYTVNAVAVEEVRQRMILHIEVDAPIVFVPAKTDVKEGPCIVVDLGRVSVNHDSGSLDVAVPDHGEFNIMMKDLNAYITDAETLVQDDDRAIIKKFDMLFQVGVRTNQDKRLPATKIKGKLPNMDIFITKEKLRDILTIVGAVLPPASLTSPPPDTTALATKTTTVTKAPVKNIEEKEELLEAFFAIEGFHLTFRDTGGADKKGKGVEHAYKKGTSLIKICFKGIEASIGMTNRSINIGAKLDRFRVKDRTVQNRKNDITKSLLASPKGTTMIAFQYEGIPKESPLYKGVEHSATGSVADLDVNINRTTLAIVLRAVDQLTKELATVPLLAAPPPSTAAKRSTTDSDGDSTMFRLKFSLAAIRLSLVKEQKKFLELCLRQTSLNLELKSDTTVDLGVSLDGLTLKDFYDTPWSYMLSTAPDQVAVSLKLSTYLRENTNYPGYDLAIGVGVASLKTVFTNRIVQELIAYFSAFAEIQSVILSATTQVTSVAVEAAKEKPTSKAKLDILVSNPLIIVPKNSFDADHYVQLDLGKIVLKNDFKTVGKEEVDEMTINVHNLNVETHQAKFISTLFLHTDIDLAIVRPVSSNTEFLIPDLELRISVPKFYFDFREKVADLIFSILGENMQEPVGSPDILELKGAESLGLGTDLSDFASAVTARRTTAETVLDEKVKPHKTLVLSAYLGQVGLSVARGTGVDEKKQSTALANFSLNTLKADITMMSDESLDLRFSLKEIILEDLRATADPQYKKIMQPHLKNDEDNMVSVHFQQSPSSMDISLTFLSPKIYAIPEWIYEVMAFGMGFSEKAMTNIAALMPPPPEQTLSEATDPTAKTTTTTPTTPTEKKQRMKMNLDVTAPLIIVPAPKPPSDGSEPVFLLDLGHVLVTNDTGPIDQPEDYNTFNIELDRIGAYIHQTNTFPLSIADAILVPFTISLGIGVKTAKGKPDLPATKLKGALDAFQIRLSKEKLKNIMAIALSVPLPPPELIPAPSTLTVEEQYQRLSLSSQKVVGDFESMFSMAFQLGVLSVVLQEDNVKGKEGKPLIDLRLKQLDVSFEQSNWSMDGKVTLDGIFIEDHSPLSAPTSSKSSEASYLLYTPKDQKLISIVYGGIPNTSPLYKDIEHKAVVRFGGLHINVNRITIALLIQLAVELGQLVTSILPPAPETPKKAPKQVQHSRSSRRSSSFRMSSLSEAEAVEKPKVLFHLDCELSYITISLVKEGKRFLESNVKELAAKININLDTTMVLGVHLQHFGVRDLYEGYWSDIASTGDQMAVDFSYATFLEYLPSYPGYDMDIGARLASLKMVFTNRIVKELVAYFGTFAQIQEIVKSNTTDVQEATMESAKQALQSEIRLNIRVEVGNPLLYVPVSSLSKDEYLLLDLGRIEVSNAIQKQGEEEVDKMAVSIQKMNIRIVTPSFEAILLPPATLDVAFSRPLSENADHAIPMKLQTKIGSFDLCFSDRICVVLLGIMKGNMSEPVVTPDVQEVQIVSKLLDFDTEAWEAKEREIQIAQHKSVSKDQNWKTFEVAAELGGLSLRLTSSELGDLVAFEMRDLIAKVDVFNSGDALVHVTLHSIVLADVRSESRNVHKRLMAPSTNVDTENQLDLTVKQTMNNDGGAHTAITIQMYAPRFVLLPDILHDVAKLGFSVLAQVQDAFKELEKTAVALSSSALSKQKEAPKKPVIAPPSSLVNNSMKLSLHLKSPEIIALQNTTMQDPSGFALSMKEIIVNVANHSSGETSKSKISVDVKSFGMMRGTFEGYNDKHTGWLQPKIYLMNPYHVSLSVEQDSSEIAISVKLGDIETIISYCDIAMVLDVFALFSPILALLPANEDLEQSALSIEEQKRAGKEKLKEEINLLGGASPKSRALVAKKHKKGKRKNFQTVEILVDSVNFSLLDDSRDSSFSVPLCKVIFREVSTKLLMYDVYSDPTLDSLEASINLGTISVNTFNTELSDYEPFIEPWAIQLDLSQSSTTLGLNISTNEMININFTKQLLDTVFNAMELSNTLIKRFEEQKDELTKAIKGKEKKKEKKKSAFFPFVLRNRTGKSVQFVVAKGQKKLIKDGDESPILAEEDSRGVVSRKLSFQVVASPKDKFKYGVTNSGIRYDVVGKQAYPVCEQGVGPRVVVHVELLQGSKIVTIRSDRVVKNHTPYDLELSLIFRKARLPQVYSLASLAEFAIPVDIEFDLITVRPAGTEYLWSEAKQGADPVATLYCAHTSNNTYWLCNGVIPENGVDTWLHLYPACHLENLLSVPIVLHFSSLPTPTAITKTKKLEAGGIYHHFEFDTKSHKDLLISVEMENYKPSESHGIYETSATGKQSDVGKRTKKHVIKNGNEQIVLFSDHFTDAKTKIRHTAIYTKYWISNATGLPLTLYTAKGEPLGGQPKQNNAPLNGDPRNWYNWDLSAYYSKAKKAEESSTTTITTTTTTVTPLAPVGDQKKKEEELLHGLAPTGPPCPRFLSGYTNKLKIQAADSELSSKFALGLSNEGRKDIEDKHSNRVYCFSVVVVPGPGRFFATSTACFYPGIILANMTGLPILYRQHEDTESADGWALLTNEQIPFHWPNKDISSRLLQVRMGVTKKYSPRFPDALESEWSSAFVIDNVTEFQIRLRNEKRKGSYLGLNVSITLQNGTTYITFSGDATPLYKINNMSNTDFEIWQKDVPKGEAPCQVIPAGRSIPFFWERPQEASRVLMIRPAGSSSEHPPREIEMDIVAKHHSLRGAEGHRVESEVKPDGPTKVLYLQDKIKEGMAVITLDDESSAESTTVAEAPVVVHLDLKVSLLGLGVCCIHEKHSLIYLTLQKIGVKFKQTSKGIELETSISVMQIDNQLYRTPFPVVFLSLHSNEKDFLTLSLATNERYEKINFIEGLLLGVQAMEIMVDGIFLLQLVTFIMDIIEHVNARLGIDLEDQLLRQKEHMLFLPPSQMQRSNWIYFQNLVLNPMQATLSHVGVTDEEEIAQTESTKSLQSILHFASLLTDLDKAPLALNGLVMEHVFSSQEDLINRLVKHYATSLLAQSYLIIGSADFLGNPVSLISNLGTGVMDFFVEPLKGITMSPKEFGRGLAKGTTSLFKSLFSVFGTTSKLTGTLAKLGVAATFDHEYQKARQRMQQQKAKNVGEGFVLGFHDLGVGIYKGITGVVTAPIDGAIKEGGIGFLKGVGKGVAGVFIKPVVGVADFATRAAEGIKNTVLVSEGDQMVPVRPARHFAIDGLLRVYSLEKAIGQKLLHLADRGNYKNEHYFYHAFLKGGDVLIVSTHYVLKISPAELEVVEGHYVTAFNYRKKSLLEVERSTTTGNIVLYFKVKVIQSKSVQIETQEIVLHEEEDINKVQKKLIHHCQPKGLQSYKKNPTATSTVNHRRTSDSGTDLSESDDDLGKVLAHRKDKKPTDEKTLLIPTLEEDKRDCCTCCVLF